MRIIFSLLVLLFAFASCKEQGRKKETEIKRLNQLWLDSIIKISDSTYTKAYKRTEFVTSTFYCQKKDSSVCQVMKDSVGRIRQIIIAKNNHRAFFAQYYTNGQIQAELPLDEFGQYHGKSIYYYEDGSIESGGNYIHGLKNGKWQNFNIEGRLIATNEYDQNGQIIKTIK